MEPPSQPPLVRLGALLTRTEAAGVAGRLTIGRTLSKALEESVDPSYLVEVRALMSAAGLATSAEVIAAMQVIEGAKSAPTIIDPVWTLPGSHAGDGLLTSSVAHFVRSAVTSVVCSTYNFAPSSALWTALKEISETTTVRVRLYVDTAVAEQSPTSTQAIADHLKRAVVFRTRKVGGKQLRNHAKVIVIDEQVAMVSSANFSASAELHNVELGLRVESAALASRIVTQLREAEDSIYERVG